MFSIAEMRWMEIFLSPPNEWVLHILTPARYRAAWRHASDLPLCRPANSQPQRRIRNKVFRTMSS